MRSALERDAMLGGPCNGSCDDCFDLWQNYCSERRPRGYVLLPRQHSGVFGSLLGPADSCQGDCSADGCTSGCSGQGGDACECHCDGSTPSADVEDQACDRPASLVPTISPAAPPRLIEPALPRNDLPADQVSYALPRSAPVPDDVFVFDARPVGQPVSPPVVELGRPEVVPSVDLANPPEPSAVCPVADSDADAGMVRLARHLAQLAAEATVGTPAIR